jgi:hypothetical protein
MDLKLTPKALNITLPRYFTDKNSERDEIIEGIIKDIGVTEELEIVADTVALDTNLETAIRIIQKLERGRQGIVRGLSFVKLRNKNASKDKSADINNEEYQRTNIIQKYWRAFLERK